MANGSNLPTQSDIDEIDRRLRELREETAFLKGRRNAALLAAWDIEEGDIVRSTGRRWPSGTLGRVTSIKPPYSLERDRPWVMVQKQKKDGSFGGNPIHFFSDWEKAAPSLSAGENGR
jgi:hypothetical protein